MLYPSFKAGTDTLTIEIPGLPLQTIGVIVHPAHPYRTSVQLPDTLTSDTHTTGNIIVYDKRSNQVTTSVPLHIQTIGDITLNGTTSGTQMSDTNGSLPVVLTSGKEGGQSYVYAALANVADSDQLADAQAISVTKPIWNSSNINAMYMLL